MDADLEILCQISEMILATELGEFGKIVREESDTAAQISFLKGQAVARGKRRVSQTGADPALLGGADGRWADWKERRLAELNMRHARILAQKQESRQKTQEAFGRAQVLKELKVEKIEEKRLISWRRDSQR